MNYVLLYISRPTINYVSYICWEYRGIVDCLLHHLSKELFKNICTCVISTIPVCNLPVCDLKAVFCALLCSLFMQTYPYANYLYLFMQTYPCATSRMCCVFCSVARQGPFGWILPYKRGITISPEDGTHHINCHPLLYAYEQYQKAHMVRANVGEVLHFRCDVHPQVGDVLHLHRHILFVDAGVDSWPPDLVCMVEGVRCTGATSAPSQMLLNPSYFLIHSNAQPICYLVFYYCGCAI
jgi:hypothetical protein